MTEQVKVVFVVGKGRSGSTLVDNLLGELTGFFSTGELWRLWDRGVRQRYLCGCGVPVPECEIWGPVLAKTLVEATARDMETWQRRALSWRMAARLLAGGGSLDPRYLATTARLYASIAEVTGSRVIVDSSKWPVHPGLLGLVPGIDPYMLQIVRDPRAVAFSWRRTKHFHDRPHPEAMPRFSTPYSAASWTGRHLLVEAARRRLDKGRARRMRYEDLIAEPESSLDGVGAWVGEPANSAAFIHGNTARFGANHSVSGNPNRLRAGETQLREDTEWKTAMGLLSKVTVTAACWPLMLRYGYPLLAHRRLR